MTRRSLGGTKGTGEMPDLHRKAYFLGKSKKERRETPEGETPYLARFWTVVLEVSLELAPLRHLL